MWGQAKVITQSYRHGGIIPTRVGTSVPNITHQPCRQDHPHACGDKLKASRDTPSPTGSSPRVWGQVIVTSHSLLNPGIIPTRVGTRQRCLQLWSRTKDHPLACGDKGAYAAVLHQRQGSSPRVWGQASRFSGRYFLYRIIPTRVGTRLKKSRKIAVLQNQPLRFPLTFHKSFV